MFLCYCICTRAGCNPCSTILDDNCCNRNPHPPAHQPPILSPADSPERKQDTPSARPGPCDLAPKACVQTKDDSAPSDGAEQDQPLEQPPDPPNFPLFLSPSHPPSHHDTPSHESKKDVQCASSLSTVLMCTALYIYIYIYNLPIQQHDQPREAAVAPTLAHYEPPHVPTLAGAVSYDVKPAAEPPKRKHQSVPSGPGKKLASLFRHRDSAYARLSHVRY